jgi:hypothetical protein
MAYEETIFIKDFDGTKKIISDKDQLFKWIQKAKQGNYTLEIKKHIPNKSREQNNFYWLLCTQLGKHLGYTSREISDQFLRMCNYTEIRKDFEGNKYEMPMSFAELNLEEVKGILTESIHFIQNNWPDFIIPDPETFKGEL